MKIPTILGVAVIITLIALSALYYYYAPQKQENDLQISDLKVVNITDTSASVVWQTSSPSIGKVVHSQFEDLAKTASDNRDRGLDKTRLIHFVTLNDLKPNTKHYYKIKNDSHFYPQKALTFSTANIQQKTEDDLTFSFIKPLKGTVLDTNLNPTDESIIFLTIPGAQTLATFSSTSGNFVLPLKTILNNELDKIFIIESGTSADIMIVKGILKSNVKILISEENMNLPPIPIGSNLDLTNFSNKPINKISFSESPFQGMDFNSDGKVNSLDLAILREAARTPGADKTQTQSRFDINADGTINQDDIEAFSKALR